jgi:hypothetical protein
MCASYRGYTPYLLVVPQESIPKYELTYNCRIMTNSRLVRSRQMGGSKRKNQGVGCKCVLRIGVYDLL